MADSGQDPEEFQTDFSGGENSVAYKTLVQDDQAALFENYLPRIGGGLTSRKGFRDLGSTNSAAAGRAILEVDQRTPSVVVFTNTGAPQYFDESAVPSMKLMARTPVTGAAFAIGNREKFRSLILAIYAAYTAAGNTFTWNVSNGAGGWIDKTAQIVEAVANSKQLRGATGEWKFNWPDFADWLPQQYNNQAYQYWLLVLCTLGGTDGLADVKHGRGKVRGDFLGRRTILTQSEDALEEWPGFTLPRQTVETFPVGTMVRRMRAAVMNNYIYYACDGQRALQRWNGSRLTSQLGGANAPSDAGLTAPPSPSFNLAITNPNANAYPNGWEIRHRAVYEYGQDGVLGKSPPSASLLTVIGGIGAAEIELGFSFAIAAAGPEVVAIRIYATNNVAGLPLAQADDISGFSQIARVERDSAAWLAGEIIDTFLERSRTEASPIGYVNTPPFYPKYVATGGGRLWIADDTRVAWSDVGRGDSWDPTNSIDFPAVTGLRWRDDKMYVWEPDNLRAIESVNISSSLPEATYVIHGIGNVQPDSLTEGEDTYYFMSRKGPVSFSPGLGWKLIAAGRTFESSSYWGSVVGERPLAQGAFFEKRWWIPIDQGGASQYVGRIGVYDIENRDGGWFKQRYLESVPQEQVFAALAAIHAPLDYGTTARKIVLVGFPDANGTANVSRLRRLEYGTSDNWGGVATDGVHIFSALTSRAVPLRLIQRWKEYRNGHVRYMLPGPAGALSIYLAQDRGIVNSKQAIVSTFDAHIRDFKFLWTQNVGGGAYREVAPQIVLVAESNGGFDLYSWWLDAWPEDFSLL